MRNNFFVNHKIFSLTNILMEVINDAYKLIIITIILASWWYYRYHIDTFNITIHLIQSYRYILHVYQHSEAFERQPVRFFLCEILPMEIVQISN